MMDLSDFENVSGKNSFWFFLISYSGSDKFLLAWDADNFDLQIILYSEGSHFWGHAKGRKFFQTIVAPKIIKKALLYLQNYGVMK